MNPPLKPLDFQEISAYTKSIFADLKKIRRHLHMHPEPGRGEFKTSAYLRDILAQSGNFEISMVGGTGFCADLITDPSLKWIAFRADIDALEIPDKKEVSYRSRVDNMCHACAHDFHATVGIGVAKVLQKFKSGLKCNVRFIFQHAEEPIPGGAIDFVRAGKLDAVEAVFGLHADPTLKVGQLGMLSGWITAQSVHIRFNISGRGGHSSKPREVEDPIFIGIHLLNELYSGVYRHQQVGLPVVFSIGKISAGSSYNAISTDFNAEGTLRITNSDQADEILAYIEQTVKTLAAKWGATSKFSYTKGADPVINDKVLTTSISEILRQVLKENSILDQCRSLGAEDFSAFLSKAPGLFIRVGVGNEKLKEPLHSSLFDIDENALVFAVNVFSWILIRYLKTEII